MLKHSILVFLMASQVVAVETIKLPAIKDNSIVMVDGEWEQNAGSAGRIRIKGNQHIVAMGFDTQAIVGKRVAKATLVCAQGEQEITGVTLSTIATDWDENRSKGVWCGIDGVVNWGYPGSRFPAVCGGNSFTLVAQAKAEKSNGEYRWEVPPDLIHAMAVGCAFGVAIHEHDADYHRNPTVFSRDQIGKQPYLLVETDDEDEPEPQSPSELQLSLARNDDSLRLNLRSPTHGFAYEVMAEGVLLARHNTPFVEPGAVQTIPIRDMPKSLRQGQPVKVVVTTISRTGRRSRPVEVSLTVPVEPAIPRTQVSMAPANPPSIADVGVIPLADKYDAAGNPIGDLGEHYRTHNSVFNGEKIQLKAAAGEVVGFQLLVRGQGQQSVDVHVAGPKVRIDLFQAIPVMSNGKMIPDPLLPMPDRILLEPDKATVIVVDCYIPFDSKAELLKGVVSISDGRQLPLEIEVLPFAIPREASFFCEMNGYGLPNSVEDFYAHQRIAYDHRLHANILHYSHNTAAPGARKSNLDMQLLSGRRMDNKRYDNIQPGSKVGFWDDFVEAFGSYLDGSAFVDGHRGPIAAPGFYLTFHESWPLNCRAYFNGNPDAYKAFNDHPEYSETYVNLLRDFAKLAKFKSWNKSGFQVYFNNKGSLAETTKAPWILDEPSSYWDYRALQFFGELTDQGLSGDTNSVRFRVDISRPEYCRGQLAGRSDLWIVSSSAFETYSRLVLDRIERDGLDAWVYGTTNHVAQSNRNIHAWALDVWEDGASGIVPWQTVNKDGSALRNADQLGLFIYSKDGEGNTVIHQSLRLKAYREAQQLIEYLNLLKAKTGWSQKQMRQFIHSYVDLSVQVNKLSESDAGTSKYSGVSASRLDLLRLATSEILRKSN